jgi:hypothetical protein
MAGRDKKARRLRSLSALFEDAGGAGPAADGRSRLSLGRPLGRPPDFPA